jgi:hypothetical protein
VLYLCYVNIHNSLAAEEDEEARRKYFCDDMEAKESGKEIFFSLPPSLGLICFSRAKKGGET